MAFTKIKTHNSKWELLLYAGIWGAVFLYPFLDAGERAIDEGSFRWEYIWQLWRNVLPFFILFLLHTFLLLPGLLFSGRIKSYALCVGLLLASFFAYQCSSTASPRRPPRHIGKIQRLHPDAADDMPHPSERLPQFGLLKPLPPKPEHHPVSGPVVIDTVIAVLLLAFGIAVKLIFNYYRQQKKIAELEKARIQEELTYLRAQISPHFFMNILNNIHGMVELDAARAQNMILDLSNLMRYVLYESSAATTPLPQEITFISNYISLMRDRYSPKKVAITYNVPEEQPTDRMFVPPLILIVFIENAFKHGISYREFSFINIRLAIEADRLLFRCINSNHGKEHAKSDGIGLKNVLKRLELLYDDDFTLEIDDQPKTFRITLNIPIYDHTMHGGR